jgi:transcriptional regulator with XRE-family HTH domain
VSFGSRKETVKSITENREFREAYLWAYLKRMVPFQIRSMRTERDWSQAKAGEILGKPQNVISRLESPAYGKLSIQTLLEIAKGFDVGLLIKFVPYSRLVREYEDVSLEALKAASPTADFPNELVALRKWADESDEEFWEAETKSNVVTSDKFLKTTPHTQTSDAFTLRYLVGVSKTSATVEPSKLSAEAEPEISALSQSAAAA